MAAKKFREQKNVPEQYLNAVESVSSAAIESSYSDLSQARAATMNVRLNVERCMEKTAQLQGYRDEALVRVYESYIRNVAKAMCGGEVDAAIGSNAIAVIDVRRRTYLLAR